jgi:outer membrane protein OmpA-like peptidoglycan-associated protein
MPTHLLARRHAALWLAAGLAACTSTPPHPSSGKPATATQPANQAPQAPQPGPPSPPAPPPPPPELAPETRWLHEWFDGTPVTVAQDDQGLVHLRVPAAHAFSAGSPTPKPALKAVLDRVAQSLSRHPQAKVTVTVPTGVPAREAAVRKYLLGQGLAAWRISVQAGTDAATELLLSPGQAPVRRLDDDKLPPPPPPAPKPLKPAPPQPAASR